MDIARSIVEETHRTDVRLIDAYCRSGGRSDVSPDDCDHVSAQAIGH